MRPAHEIHAQSRFCRVTAALPEIVSKKAIMTVNFGGIDIYR